MLDNGALNSIMSGSGPTVFGLFDDKEKAQQCVRLWRRKVLHSSYTLQNSITNRAYDKQVINFDIGY